METLLWALGIFATIQMVVTGFLATRLWTHVAECKSVSTDIAYIKSDVERMKTDIGTHSSGLRGAVHAATNLCTQHEMRISILERQKS